MTGGDEVFRKRSLDAPPPARVSLAMATGVGLWRACVRWLTEPSAGPRSSAGLRAWYAASAVLILLGPVQWYYGRPLTDLASELQPQAWLWALAFLAQVGSLALTRAARGGWAPWSVPVHGAAVFVPTFVALDRLGLPASSAVLLVSATSAQLALLLPTILGRAVWAGAGALGAGVVAVLWMGRASSAPEGTPVISTAFHSVIVREYEGLAGPPAMPGGAITGLGDGFLVVTGVGELHRLDWGSDGETLTSSRVPLDIELNLDPFRAALPEIVDRLGGGFFLRTLDIAVDESATPERVYVAHQYWNIEERCFTVRVSTASLPGAGATAPPAPWSVLWESQPCIPPSYPLRHGGMGARLAWLGRELLLSIGDYGLEAPGELQRPQDPTNPYGKIGRLDPETGAYTLFSSGHRNPQGLVVAPDGRVWSTEHGPQGGDEVNHIVEGGNYGWPLVSYGRQYGQDSWPMAEGRRDHASFVEPAIAFVPSIGVSNLIYLNGKEFTGWEGDLLVTSLRAEQLVRLRTRGDRVVYEERIPIGDRIRDVEQARDGRILLWTDLGARVLVLSAAPEALGGARAYSICSQCHGEALQGTDLGPPLLGILGKDVASEPGFDYSPALRALGGRWTQERLELFVADPSGYAPGTRMAMPPVPEELLFQLVEYIRLYGSDGR